jgi:hypothetical protein
MALLTATNGATALTAYNPGQGGSGTGGAYSFGMAASTERAFGTIGSNAASAGGYAYGFILQNTGASALAISLAYEGEQWRVSGAAPQTRNFSFKTSSTNPNAYADWSPTAQLPVGYTALPALDFTSPNTGNPSGSVNGNLPANCTSFADTLVGTVQPNDYLVVRWYDPNQSGNDHGLGIDNVTLSAIVAVPEPASILAVCGIAGFAGNVVRRRWAPRKVAV